MALHAGVQDHRLQPARIALGLPDGPGSRTRLKQINSVAHEMHESEPSFLLADFPQPAAVSPIKLKLIDFLLRHLHRNCKAVVVRYGHVDGACKRKVMAHL